MSVGTVWTVGGLAPFSSAIPDGRGGFLESGTNAPLYTTPFTSGRKNPEDDIEKHESRLAEALDMDRTSRVLEFRDRSVSPKRPLPNAKSKSVDAEGKTVWKGTEWVPGSPNRSKYSTSWKPSTACYADLSLLYTTSNVHLFSVNLNRARGRC